MITKELKQRDRVIRLSRSKKEAILRDLAKGITYQDISRKRKTGRGTIAKLKRSRANTIERIKRSQEARDIIRYPDLRQRVYSLGVKELKRRFNNDDFWGTKILAANLDRLKRGLPFKPKRVRPYREVNWDEFRHYYSCHYGMKKLMRKYRIHSVEDYFRRLQELNIPFNLVDIEYTKRLKSVNDEQNLTKPYITSNTSIVNITD